MSVSAICIFVFASIFLAETKTIIPEKEIEALVEQMGDERFYVREKAYRQLAKILQEDWAHLLLPVLEKATKHKDPEIAYRAKLVIEHHYYVLPTNYPKLPCIDMLPDYVPDRENIIKKYLELFSMDALANDQLRYRLATAVYIHDLLKKGARRLQVRELLDKMVENEKKWEKDKELCDKESSSLAE